MKENEELGVSERPAVGSGSQDGSPAAPSDTRKDSDAGGRSLTARGSLPAAGRPVVRWERITKFDPRGAALADRHYNRRKVGSPQWMPPGETLNLLTEDGRALFGWWRPHPSSGIAAMNGLDGWTCTIFRNEGEQKSSLLILEAEAQLQALGRGCGPSGMLTYVWDSRVASPNPGYCFKMAGWEPLGRSADDRKTLLHKPFEQAGIEPAPGQCYGPDGKGCYIPHDCDGKCSWAPWMAVAA